MTNKKMLLYTAFSLSLVSVFSRLLGFLREMVIAWRFGAGAGVDAYVAAMAVPQILVGIITGALGATFLPVYSSERAAGRGGELAATTFSATIFISVAGGVLGFWFAPQLVQGLVGNFSPDQQALTVVILRVLTVVTVIGSVTFFISLLLNAHKHFFWPSVPPLMMSIVVIGGLAVFGASGITGLAWLTVIGMFVAVVWLLALAVKYGLPIIGKPKFTDKAFLRMATLTLPIFASTLFGQIYVIVDRRLASGLDVGSMAALNFANRLVGLPIGLVVTALVTVVYPTLADLAAKGDKQGLGVVLTSSLRILFIIMVPAAVGLVVLRYPLVSLAFERGSFDSTATARTAVALGYYAVGLVGLSAGALLPRAFHALQDTVTPVKISLALLPVSIGLVVVLTRALGLGGIALTASVMPTLGALVQVYVLKTRLRKNSLRVGGLLAKVTISSVVMGLICVFVLDRASVFGQIIALGATVAVGGLVYGLGLIVFKVDEVWTAIGLVKDKIIGLRSKGV
ncbi:MAG: murein biosynthesis integral membrane protein MurJ [Peptococcaceae bacterium]|nr:murein biosynthesis integral membrane protein MurJ [Peptococcaceae bacterium]